MTQTIHFQYQQQQLCVEDVPLQLIAQQYGTPCYVYSKRAITNNWQAFADAFATSGHKHQIFYAIKANSSLAILKLLNSMGAGFDAVSGGEIERVLVAGGNPQKIVFSGVGKSNVEIKRAIDLGIYSIHVESIAELERIQEIAQQCNKRANIALRINPDVAIDSHAYISTGSKSSKFGIDYVNAVEIYCKAQQMPNINIRGISCHIGSQIDSLKPFLSAIDQLLAIIEQLTAKNIQLEYIDVGGGLGIPYQNETMPSTAEYIAAITDKLQNSKLAIHIEPGRAIVANAGILLTKVEYLKTTGDNNFVIVDAAMNDLIRPALYHSYHEIIPVRETTISTDKIYNVVGPVCETGDFLGEKRALEVKSGDLLAVMTAGAYGFCMSSNYNTRPHCAEVLVNGSQINLINQRQTLEQLWQNEKLIDV